MSKFAFNISILGLENFESVLYYTHEYLGVWLVESKCLKCCTPVQYAIWALTVS